MRRALASIVFVTVACGGESSHPAANLSPSGDGGSSGSGGGGGVGGGIGGGAGGSGGGAMVCLGAASFDAKRVYLTGVLGEGGPESCVGLAPSDMPLAVCAGFATTNPGTPTVHPTNGHLVYLHAVTKDVRVFQPDAFAPGKTQTWACDTKGTDNDPALPTPGCAAAAVLGFFLEPDDGSLVYACDGKPGWFDATGPLALSLGFDLVALGHKGVKLAHIGADPSDVLTVVSAAGQTVGSAKLGVGVRVVRAAADGFTIAQSTSPAGWEQWRMSAAGVSAKTGTYSDLPAATMATGARVLDGDGALWETVHDAATNEDYVVARSVSAATKIVYSPKGLPLADWAATPPILYISSANVGLVSGP